MRFLAPLAALLLLLARAEADGGVDAAYYPAVTALSGTLQWLTKPVKSWPNIRCAKPLCFATADSEIEVARNIMDAYFAQIVVKNCTATKGASGLVDLGHGKTAQFCCTGKYLYPDGKEVGTILGTDYWESRCVVSQPPHHYSVTGCFPGSMKAGKTYTAYGQGVLNYYCSKDKKKTVKQVALIKTKGSFVAQ